MRHAWVKYAEAVATFGSLALNKEYYLELSLAEILYILTNAWLAKFKGSFVLKF